MIKVLIISYLEHAKFKIFPSKAPFFHPLLVLSFLKGKKDLKLSCDHVTYIDQWLNHGGDITNRRKAVGELLISPTTVRNLRLKWRFIAGFDISATPAVANGVVYFPSWNGYLYAVRANNGALIWKQNLGHLTGLPPTGTTVNVTVSRTTPTVAGDLLIIGIYGPAVVIGVKRLTGQLVWLTRLDPRPLAVITSSGTFYLG